MNTLNILKRKNKKLVLKKIISENTYDECKFSYSRIYLTDKEVEGLLNWLISKGQSKNILELWNVSGTLQIDYKQYPQVLTSFMRKVSEAKTNGKFEKVPNKVVPNNISGTSALLRNSDQTVIKIVWRKRNKDEINKVCISDGLKEQFFKKSIQLHGRPADKNYCIYVEDGKEFQYWSKLMNDIYFNSLVEYEENKKEEEIEKKYILNCVLDTNITLPQARYRKICGGCKYSSKCWNKTNKEFVNETYKTNF